MGVSMAGSCRTFAPTNAPSSFMSTAASSGTVTTHRFT
jgi:hypothetical protein